MVAERSNRAPARVRRRLGGRSLLLGVLALALVACGRTADAPPTVEPTPTAAPATPAPTATPIPQDFEPSEHLAGARQLLREGRYDEAAAAFEETAAATQDAALASEALLGAGMARYEAGDLAGAIEALARGVDRAPPGSLLQRRIAYLLGVRLDESGRAAEAAGVLGPYVAAPVDDTLQRYVAAAYARAAADAGDPATASRTWDALLEDPGLPTALRADVFADRARLAEAQGDAAAAARWLGEAVALLDDPEMRFHAATLALDAGDAEAFAGHLRAIIANHPSSRYAVLAIAELRLHGLAVDPGEEGYVYYCQRAYREARITLADAIDEEGISDGERAFRLYYLAAAYDDAGFKSEAVPYYDRAVALDPDGTYGHRGRYWAARAFEDLGETAEASRRYVALYTGGPPGPFTGEAGFRAGYVWYVAGEPRSAIETWNALGIAGDPRLAYWRGRAFELLGDGEAAKLAYQEASRDPRSFYGAEAARQLAGAGELDAGYVPLRAPGAPDWDAIEAWLAGIVPRGAPTTGGGSAAADLAGIGLADAAERVLLAEADGSTEPWGLLALIREAHDAGLLDVAIRLGRALEAAVGVEEQDLPEAFLRVLYPLDVPALLDAAARRNGIDPLLLAALVLQESLWDGDAVSIAGAMGLTQVMPATGAGIARDLGHDGFTAGELFRPAVSLEFGAYYLGVQLRRFGDVHHALAAYNGGPGNAAAWAAAAPEPPPDFVEAVTFAETEHYVEAVMEHYHMYRWLYRRE